MDDGYTGIQILVLIGLVILEAVFYGFGSALQNVNETELESQMESGSRKAARLLRILNRPTLFINTSQAFTSAATLIVGAFIFRKAVWSSQNPVSILAEALVYIIFLVSFGMVIPKRCAARNPEQWGYATLPIISLFMTVLRPLTAVITAVCFLALKAVGIDMFSKEDNVTEEDIMSMVNEGHEQGVLEAGEAEMITNIFQLNDKQAEDVMTHRKNVVLLDGSMSLKDAIHFILSEGNHSRFPVFGDDQDDIVGVIHLRDVMVWAEKEAWENTPIRQIPDLMMEPHFVPESRSVDSLFREMQSQKVHMVVVVDEYGQMSGIVTMEDILEEIVGNIMDEYDEEEEFIRPLEDGSFLINGLAPLEEVAQTLEIQLGEEDQEAYDTLNGFLISRLDRIPGEEERPVIPFGGYDFCVERMENKRIAAVRAVRRPDSGTCQPEKMVVE